MLSQFLLYSKMNQPYIYLRPLSLGLPSRSGHHSTLSRVPYATWQVLISYLIYRQYQQCIYVDPNLSILPTPPFPLVIHKFILYVCISFSALQMRSSIPLPSYSRPTKATNTNQKLSASPIILFVLPQFLLTLVLFIIHLYREILERVYCHHNELK